MGGNKKFKVSDVEARHKSPYTGTIFFKVRAYNKCHEPGEWSTTHWFTPHVDVTKKVQVYDHFEQSATTWPKIALAMCSPKTGEVDKTLMTPAN